MAARILGGVVESKRDVFLQCYGGPDAAPVAAVLPACLGGLVQGAPLLGLPFDFSGLCMWPSSLPAAQTNPYLAFLIKPKSRLCGIAEGVAEARCKGPAHIPRRLRMWPAGWRLAAALLGPPGHGQPAHLLVAQLPGRCLLGRLDVGHTYASRSKEGNITTILVRSCAWALLAVSPALLEQMILEDVKPKEAVLAIVLVCCLCKMQHSSCLKNLKT